MADKIVVLRDGYVAQIGSPLDLYDKPANAFVAEFIGSPSMNLIDATLSHQDGGVWANVGSARFPVAGSCGAENGRAVRLGVRPENLMPADDGLPAEVSVVERTGPETHVILRTEGSELTAVIRDRRNFKPGEKIHLKPGSDAVHLFDRKSGARIG